MSLMQRRKGKTFERKIARAFRERFPEIADVIRRSIQSRGAEESDVVCPGLWIECQDARRPDPKAKLAQAICDTRYAHGVPIAVTHKLGARTVQVSLRLKDLVRLMPVAWNTNYAPLDPVMELAVTMELEAFFVVLSANKPWRERA